MVRTVKDIKDQVGEYEKNTQELERFLKEFSTPHGVMDPKYGSKKYGALLQRVANRLEKVVSVELDDLELWDEQEGTQLLPALLGNTQRYITKLLEACDHAMPQPDERMSKENMTLDEELTRERLERIRETSDVNSKLPSELTRQYELRLVPQRKMKALPLRQVLAEHVGGYVKMDCVVTRVQSVKPKMKVMVYECGACGCEIFKMVEGDSFMPVVECNSQVCKTNKTGGKISAQIKRSRMVKFQEVRVQEPASQVPIGSVPRSMVCVVTGENTRQLLPGDSVTLAGAFLPIAKFGFAAMRSGLTADTYLEVHSVTRHKRGYSEDMEQSEEVKRMRELSENGGEFYDRLAYSIAPEIWGHEDVKKALLLLLVGGVTKQMADGMRIRGDLHVLLMGDPGVAKSQLIRQITNIAPRAVYTTGKGSSGVGLTACVVRDKRTGEVTLEGGALVLADNGVCCIDEFDKMDESDRTAIHEVMEQQTVSIAKAGITTTLNARTSVLAAANPVYGRYDIRKSAVANMNLPAALLSRFDLQFLLLDIADREKDAQLASHVLHVHQMGVPPPSALPFKPFDAAFIRAYIAEARKHEPFVPNDLMADIVQKYVDLRQNERMESKDDRKSYTTPRTLLGILRMSQALARLRFADEVERGDFEEAVRLMDESKRSILPTGEQQKKRDPKDALWTMVIDLHKQLKRKAKGKTQWLNIKELEVMAQRKGYTPELLSKCLKDYEALETCMYSANGLQVQVVGDNDEDEHWAEDSDVDM